MVLSIIVGVLAWLGLALRQPMIFSLTRDGASGLAQRPHEVPQGVLRLCRERDAFGSSCECSALTAACGHGLRLYGLLRGTSGMPEAGISAR